MLGVGFRQGFQSPSTCIRNTSPTWLLGRRPAYAVNVGRAAYFVYRPPGDLSWRGSAVFV
jgi:hypothetical protein